MIIKKENYRQRSSIVEVADTSEIDGYLHVTYSSGYIRHIPVNVSMFGTKCIKDIPVTVKRFMYTGLSDIVIEPYDDNTFEYYFFPI